MDSPARANRPHLLEERLQQARHGSKEALAEAFRICSVFLRRKYRDQIPQALHAKFGDADVQEDTFREVWEAFADFRGSTALAFARWVETIWFHQLHNTLRFYRAQQRNVAREEALDDWIENDRWSQWLRAKGRPLLDQLCRKEEKDRVIGALAVLAAKDRRGYQVVHLHVFEQMSFPKIGEELNLSAETVRPHWRRARQFLRRRLPDLGFLNEGADDEGPADDRPGGSGRSSGLLAW